MTDNSGLQGLWIIYYDDREPFSYKDGTPADAPADGIQMILCYDSGVQDLVTLQKYDWYWYSEKYDEWCGGDLQGYLDHAKHLGSTWPKQGRVIGSAHYMQIKDQAWGDRLRLLSGG